MTKQIRDFRRNIALLSMLVPGAILLILFYYLPTAGIVIAFKRLNLAKGVLQSPWCGFENFRFFIESPQFPLVIRNTLGYNIIFMVLGNIISLTVAICLNEMRNKKASKFYQSVMLMPYFLSWIAISYLCYAFLSMDKGLINTYLLDRLGLPSINWYQEVKAWPGILIFMNRWRYTGYDMVIYLAALTSLDVSLYEAARVDGAGKLQQIRSITLPLMQEIVIVVVLLGLGRMFIGDFDLFYVIPRSSGPLFPVTQVMDTYVYRALIQSGNVSMAAAAGLFQSLIGFVLVLLVNQLIRVYDPEKSMF